MPYEIDYFTRLVKITSPDVLATGQGLHDFIEDQMASPIGMVSDGNTPFKGDILKPEGKIEDPTNPGVFSQIILLLSPEWQIQFWPGSGYTKITGAKILGGVGDEPIKATGAAGDITVLESPVDGVLIQSGTSGLTSSESDILSDIHGQVERAVFIDTEAAVNGNGYQQSPYNNWSDAVDYAEANGLKKLVVLADATVDRQLKNFTIEGIGTPTIDCNGQNLDKSKITHCTMTGLYSGRLITQDCNLVGTFNINGFFENCALGSDFIVPDGGIAFVKDCSAFVVDANIPTFDVGGVTGTGILSVSGWNGPMKVINVNQASDLVAIANNASSVILDASCIGGKISVDGMAHLDNLSNGSVVTGEPLDPHYLHEAWQRLDLDADNPMTHADSSIVGGDIDIQITDNLDGTYTAERQ